MTRLSQSVVAMLLSVSLPTSLVAREYTVRAGDTLSGISGSEVYRPVYGDKGSLKTVVNTNPKIKNVDLIYPGQIILLPGETVTDAKDQVVEEQQPVAEETPVVADSKEEASTIVNGEPDRISKIHIGLLGYETQIRSVDSSNFKTETQSGSQFGVAMGYDHFFNERWQLGLKGSYRKANFDASSDKRRDGYSESLLGMGAELGYSFIPKLTLFLTAALNEQLFVVQNASSNLAIKKTFVEDYGLKLSYQFLNLESFSLGVSGEYDFANDSAGDHFHAKKGTHYGADLFSSYDVSERVALLGSLFYDRRSQDTNKTEQTVNEMGILAGVSYRFGQK